MGIKRDKILDASYAFYFVWPRPRQSGPLDTCLLGIHLEPVSLSWAGFLVL